MVFSFEIFCKRQLSDAQIAQAILTVLLDKVAWLKYYYNVHIEKILAHHSAISSCNVLVCPLVRVYYLNL